MSMSGFGADWIEGAGGTAPMDAAVDEALRAYIAKREAELPEGVE